MPEAWSYPYSPPVPAPQPKNMICDRCGEEIKPTERSVNVFIGRAGYGPKSGQAMVVEDREIEDAGLDNANVHLQCLLEFAEEAEAMIEYRVDDVVNDDIDPEADDSVNCIHCGVILDVRACCAGCDAKLSPNWG